MKVFFDASVIIVALLSPNGGSAQLFKFIKRGRIVGVTSQNVIEEVIAADKPKKIKRTMEEMQQFIVSSDLVVREAITIEEIEQYQNKIDKEDAHLIAGARLTKCTYLVSLDKKHVLKDEVRKRFLPLKIVSPKELLEELA